MKSRSVGLVAGVGRQSLACSSWKMDVDLALPSTVWGDGDGRRATGGLRMAVEGKIGRRYSKADEVAASILIVVP